jgi:hypothetical protein
VVRLCLDHPPRRGVAWVDQEGRLGQPDRLIRCAAPERHARQADDGDRAPRVGLGDLVEHLLGAVQLAGLQGTPGFEQALDRHRR